MIGVLRLPDEIRFGSGARGAIGSVARAAGERVLVVADPFLADTAPFREAMEGLHGAGAVTEVITDVPPELPVAVVEASGERASRFRPDVVLGYGGGSSLDAAKLIATLVAHGGSLADYYGENAVPGPIVPVIAVPTTAGTGSEVTPVAVVSDPARALKVGVSSPFLVPRAAIVDPDLTLTAPAGVTAHSGIDAFVHAVESYTAAGLGVSLSGALPVFVGRNALSDPLSLEAAGLIYRALPTAVSHPDDRAARESMARGSLLAGMAFGATGTHLSHAVQYPVGAMTHTPHGLGTGTLLPYVLQACLPRIGRRLVDLGVAMGVLTAADADEPDAAQRVVDAVAGLVASAGLPGSLGELGLTSDDVPEVTRLTLEVGRLVAISPVDAAEATISRLVTAAITGDRASLAAPRKEER